MIQHPSALLVHQCIQAVQWGDPETLRALWDEEIAWRIRGDSPWKGDIHGIDAVLEHLAEVGELGSGYDASIGDVLVGQDRVAVLCHVKARIGDEILEVPYVILCRIVRRRIKEVVSVPLDPDRVADFWREARRWPRPWGDTAA